MKHRAAIARGRKLRRRKAVASCRGEPYRITRRGLELVRSQLDNR
ncbi:MAG: YjhX family toxin [Alphaproteobacteria bacterium]|nr:YjhX family toxin [Alphaproteobacteria bacterium]MBU0802145.1 YjhX family toxin [Alphaproteobacteria bacterium]MBU0872249.1 YjhX family toxin [Alphaproteobacteria bacterium]MBU1399644.1 YjhX family toxin [Alphaproteobacteria bacterium]MBU1590030.1 YjhX family toxin [Alphaproteobacteria bacterium]